jgi:hypothetical protein
VKRDWLWYVGVPIYKLGNRLIRLSMLCFFPVKREWAFRKKRPQSVK